jgi:hypothetical protein
MTSPVSPYAARLSALQRSLQPLLSQNRHATLPRGCSQGPGTSSRICHSIPGEE